MAPLGLFVEPAQLHVQYGALPFAQPVVRSVNVVAIEPFAGHTPTVMHGAGLHLELVVVRDDDPAFARGDQLARLKTESAGDPKSPDALPAPFAGVRVRRVFDQQQLLVAGDLFQTI